MQQKKTIAILGCGWLGLKWAKQLANKGFQVKGSTRSTAKKNEFIESGIEHFVLDETHAPLDELKSFTSCDLFMIAIPSSKISKDFLASLCQYIDPEKTKIILISSTGIYRETNEILNENAPLEKLNITSPIYKTELFLQELFQGKLTILRAGGLIGYDRDPVRFAFAESVRKNPDGRINLIHVDQLMQVLDACLDDQIGHGIFNVCQAEHPTKKDYYSRCCLLANLTPPDFLIEEQESFKIIDSSKLFGVLGVEF
ncbi:MAG: hypothetical protein IPM74_06830 [Crocinitomicaceae bacterium]|nr:hypothetical protein [Crocinitomicaceae bacterium]